MMMMIMMNIELQINYSKRGVEWYKQIFSEMKGDAGGSKLNSCAQSNNASTSLWQNDLKANYKFNQNILAIVAQT